MHQRVASGTSACSSFVSKRNILRSSIIDNSCVHMYLADICNGSEVHTAAHGLFLSISAENLHWGALVGCFRTLDSIKMRELLEFIEPPGDFGRLQAKQAIDAEIFNGERGQRAA